MLAKWWKCHTSDIESFVRVSVLVDGLASEVCQSVRCILKLETCLLHVSRTQSRVVKTYQELQSSTLSFQLRLSQLVRPCVCVLWFAGQSDARTRE